MWHCCWKGISIQDEMAVHWVQVCSQSASQNLTESILTAMSSRTKASFSWDIPIRIGRSGCLGFSSQVPVQPWIAANILAIALGNQSICLLRHVSIIKHDLAKRPLSAVDQLPDLMFCLCSKWRSVKYPNQHLRTFTRSKGRLMVNSSMPGMWSTLTLIPGSVYLEVFQNSNLIYC